MYFVDHEPPHFHVEYGENEAVVQIRPVGMPTGFLPRRVLALAIEWATLHEGELLKDGRKLHSEQLPSPIAPLE